MDNGFELFPLLAYLLPVLCCFCYGLMLIFRRESRVKRIMGIMMLMACLCYAMSLAYDSVMQQDGRVPILNVWHMGSVLMMCPVIGWYLTLLIRPDAKFFPHHFLFMMPFFLSVIGTLLFLRFAPATPNVYTIKDYLALLGDYPEAGYRLVLTVAFVAELVYMFTRTELQLKAHRIRMKNDFSYTEKVDLSWVQILVIMTLFCCALNFVYAFTASVQARTVYNILFFVVIVSQCVYGGTHDDIYYLPEPKGAKKPRYARPPHAALLLPQEQEKVKLSPVIQEKIREGLTDLLERQEIYCKPDLRLDDLAEMLHTNKTYVSLVINESFHTSFYTLINRYRVKKAVDLLEKQQVQVKDIWAQSGFHSQSVFNAVFKKEMQLTPSEWLKKQNVEH